MSVLPMSTLKDSGKKFGEYHSWWLPDSPKDGEAWGHVEHSSGYKSSDGHRRSPDGKYRSGGPFLVYKYTTTNGNNPPSTIWRKDLYPAYQGQFFADVGWFYDYSFMGIYQKDSLDITSSMLVYGAEAYERLRPDKPDFSPLQDLIETLREVPSLWIAWKQFNKRFNAELARKSKKRIFMGKTGRYHLAVQFGVMPLISSTIQFLEAWHGADKRVLQLLKDNGKWVRRRVVLSRGGTLGPDDELPWIWHQTHPDPWHPDVQPALKAECYVQGSHATVDFKVGTRSVVWAVGKSKYFLGPGYTSSRREISSIKRNVYADMRITPDLVYNLVPWSWLMDYFTSLGSLFGALSGGLADSIIFDYAYIMRTDYESHQLTYTQRVYTSKSGEGNTTCSITKEGVIKGRLHASLFGFGLTHEDLSPLQVGILGALGLSTL